MCRQKYASFICYFSLMDFLKLTTMSSRWFICCLSTSLITVYWEVVIFLFLVCAFLLKHVLKVINNEIKINFCDHFLSENTIKFSYWTEQKQKNKKIKITSDKYGYFFPALASLNVLFVVVGLLFKTIR